MKSNPARLLVVLLSGFFSAPPQATAATLVEKGQARAVIVVPAKPSPVVGHAARVLRDHIRQISGAELPIRTEDRITGAPTQDRAWVLVGEGKLTAKLGLTSQGLGPGGIVQSAKGQVLALFGTDAHTPSDPGGTRYAVTTFLEDKLGVRYLWPGEVGKVVPRRATITVADFQHRFTPKLAQRHIRSMGYHNRLQVGLDRLGFTKTDYERLRDEAQRTQAESPDWFGWQRLGGTLNLKGGHAFTHLWAKYGKDHPEWFALQPDGSRDQSKNPDRARLCVSNPALIVAIAQEKIAELSQQPNLLGVSIAPNDGGRTTFCTCPACEALDSPKGRKVLLWDFTKMMGTDFDSCCHHWATQGLNYYVVARLHWNPDQDVDALVDDYCQAGFGPAAKSVRRYFDGLEALLGEAATRKGNATTVFSLKALGRLRQELEQARREAGTDHAIAERIAFLELGLRWTEIEVRARAFLTEPAKADKRAAKKTLAERFALMREVFQKTPLALNVAYISWGEDALWSRLGWQRPATKR